VCRTGCRGRIAEMTVPEALRVDTEGSIKPDMAFLALLGHRVFVGFNFLYHF
jgi:hypothetical protein